MGQSLYYSDTRQYEEQSDEKSVLI